MRKFKTESQKILDIMINSIYTNKEIFLRELISNCSDAIDKLYFKSLSENISGLTRDSFSIRVDVDKDERTITVSDNGIGMTAEELDSNLGVIARSGSSEFKAANVDDNIDIIGQFGVGFYSAFMVAKKVKVLSKKYGETEANVWTSSGVEGYEIKPAEKEGYGTEITLYLKDDTDEENYDRFLEEYTLRDLIKKYSDYIRYPIVMQVTEYQKAEEGEEEQEVKVNKTVNSMTPLWVKNKSEVKEEEYNEFYKANFYDYEDPLLVIHTKVEGKVDYKALLYVPAKAPYDYYSKNYEKGLKLYTAGVMISEKCADLLPDCFSFVKGLVDSDLPLNISRETIQQNHQLKAIAANLETKIQKELLSLMEKDREKYEKFYKAFGLQLKYGAYADWGMHKDLVQDLLLWRSVKDDKMVSLKEYVEAMPEGQPAVYYGVGRSVEMVKAMPQSEQILDKGYDVLCFDADIDEFAVKMLRDYKEKTFANIADEVAEESEEKADDHQDVFDFAKEHLGDKVSKVKPTQRLKSHAVCLTAMGDVSLEMERVLNAMPNAEGNVRAERVLEINTTHPVFDKLVKLFAEDKDKAADLVDVLYDHACMSVGLAVDNPASYVAKVTKLLTE